jgi:ACS family pantothenate transporter-like MFS transporter
VTTTKITRRDLVNVFKDWKVWVFVPLYTLYGFGVQNGQQFGVYLKAYGYSVARRNILPSGMYLIEIPWLLGISYMSDRLSRFGRGYVMIIPLIWGLVPTSILAFWAPSDHVRVFAFMMNGTIYMTPVFYAWLAELCGQNTVMRAFITAATSSLFYWHVFAGI